jgi:Skp family chaperone for outer membrane proteins
MTRATSLAALVLFATSTASAAQTLPDGIAYFSPARAFALSADGKAAQSRLTAFQADKAAQIEARRKSLQGQQEELAKGVAVLSDAARAQRTQTIQRFEVDLDRFMQDAQAEVMGVQRDLEGAFLVRLRPALANLAKDRALKLVINEDVGLIAWADPALDITPMVVEALSRLVEGPPSDR